ncbi:MAG: protein kinase [Methylococcaceae bacterium]|nr:protein kinase [Methylococcaceae bacterium]
MADHLETQCGFATEAGKRESNEDFVAFYQGTEDERAIYGSVAIITDGIGGTGGGRYAAELAVREFIDAYYEQKETLGVKRMAENSLVSINRWIHSQSLRDSAHKGMGTTFSALIFLGSQVHVIHLGDTRIYRLRNSRLECLTTDHVHQHPDLQHVLTRALGIDDTVHIDYSQHNLNLHDRFLLCCDGIHTSLTDKKIQYLLCLNQSTQDHAQTFVKEAIQAGSHDNVSALVIDVLKLPPPDKSFLETAVDDLAMMAVPKVNDYVDGFYLKSKLSNSRYTCLFLASDQDGRHGEVVLKFPKPEANSEEIYRQAFIRENWITSHVHNPWIAEQVELETGRRTSLYTVMPYYQGETLEHCLLENSISLDMGVEISLMLCKAVYSLHKERVIHRDIKPENIILLKQGGLKLLDLGVARLPGLDDELESTAPGTPSYMAPQLFRGDRGNEHSDLYALGVTLYRMFSKGHYPYGEVEPFTRPSFDKPVPLGQYRPDLPSWLEVLLLRAVNPEKGFTNAMDLAFELENGLARGITVLPMKPSLSTRVRSVVGEWFN